METILAITFIVICGIVWGLIYTPILIYHLYRYSKRGTNIVYLLRYCNITVIQSILFILKLLYGILATVSSLYIYDHNSPQDLMIRAVNAYLAAFFLYCFVWKFWLLRYNIMLNNIVINSEWKSILNPIKYQANKTFYAKYKKTWGNTLFTMWYFLALALIFTTIYVLTHLVYPEFYGGSSDTNPYLLQLYAGWDYIIPFLILIVIYVKTPKFDDNFYITKEMRYIFYCLCIQYSVYYGYLVIMSMIWPTDDITEDTIFLIEFQIVIGVQFISMIISTAWVNKQCDDIIDEHRYQIHKISSKLRLNIEQKHCIEITPKPIPKHSFEDAVGRKETMESTKGSSQGIINHLDTGSYDHDNVEFQRTNSTFRDGIYDLLSYGVTYNAFMVHLSKEFSIECLLSLTEFIQFRDHIKLQIKEETTANNTNNIIDEQTNNIDVDTTATHLNHGGSTSNFSEISRDDSREISVVLPSDVPRSYIVDNEEWNNKEKAYKLYAKYIENGSELEINISCDQRRFYDDIMANYSQWMDNDDITNRDLIDLFIPCCSQMIYLMIDSRKRFEETAIFEKLQRNRSK